MRSWWLRPRAAIRDLNPGYFALVMATGMVSKAMRLDGAARLSSLLPGAGSWPTCCLQWPTPGGSRATDRSSSPTRVTPAGRSRSSPSPPRRTCWPRGWLPPQLQPAAAGRRARSAAGPGRSQRHLVHLGGRLSVGRRRSDVPAPAGPPVRSRRSPSAAGLSVSCSTCSSRLWWRSRFGLPGAAGRAHPFPQVYSV